MNSTPTSNAVTSFAMSYRHPRSMMEAKYIYQDKLNEKEQKLYLKMDEEMIRDYFDIFNIFDENRSGSINSFEITKVF